jgi:hypothetical protein
MTDARKELASESLALAGRMATAARALLDAPVGESAEAVARLVRAVVAYDRHMFEPAAHCDAFREKP